MYHKLKDKIHTTPDTPEIRQVKKTQEAVSEVSIFLGEETTIWSVNLYISNVYVSAPPPHLVDLQIGLLQDAGSHDLTAVHTPSVALSLCGRHHQ